jgi:hypothetical protein
VGVFKAIVYAVFPFSYLNLTNRGKSASRGGMADEAGIPEYNKVGFICRGVELGGQNIRNTVVFQSLSHNFIAIFISFQLRLELY